MRKMRLGRGVRGGCRRGRVKELYIWWRIVECMRGRVGGGV